MSLETLERSREDAQPLTLYSFALDGQVWRYANVDADVVAGGFTWLAAAISDDGIKQSGEAVSDGLNITAPMWIGPVQMHMQTPPSRPIRVRIYYKDNDNTAIAARYAGEISQVDLSDPGSAKIACEDLSSSMRRQGLRLGWQRSCPYALYDELTCKVDKTAFAIDAVILRDLHGAITVEFLTSVADHWLDGGFIEWTGAVRGYEARMIESQAVNDLTMFGPTDDLFPGMAIKCYPGCNLTSDCVEKFDNLVNNGACKFMPGKSPFDGSPVF